LRIRQAQHPRQLHRARLIKTDFAKALWDNPETLKASTARSPLLRIGIPDEIAGAAVFMGSAAGDS